MKTETKKASGRQDPEPRVRGGFHSPPAAFTEFILKCESLRQAAVWLGVSDQFLYQIRAGRRGIPASRAFPWAWIIGCTVHDLRPDMDPTCKMGPFSDRPR